MHESTIYTTTRLQHECDAITASVLRALPLQRSTANGRRPSSNMDPNTPAIRNTAITSQSLAPRMLRCVDRTK